MFCRYCGDDFAGLVSRKMAILASQYAFTIPSEHLLPPDKQKNVKALLKDYYESAADHLIRLSKDITRLERRNKEILMTKGDLDLDKKEQLSNQQLTFEKLLSSTEILADLLGEDLPDLTFRSESEAKSDEETIEKNDDEEDKVDKQSQWEDDDSKSFYLHLVDIKAIVPGILFEATKSDLDAKQSEAIAPNTEMNSGSLDKSKITEEQLDDIMDLEALEENDVLDPSNNFGDDKEAIEDLEQDILKEEEIEKNEIGQSTSKRMLFEAFISNLPTCVNRTMIDNAAAEFCMTFNTKANRKKLVKALFSVNRNRIDLLPFYARFIATINPCTPDVSADMSNLLKREFRWQVRKKDQMKIESKLKVCRFIGELVKFSLFESSDCIFCLKMLLFDFSHHNIEMACVLLETCGRFLFYAQTTRQRTRLCLESMMRKKAGLSLDPRYVMMIENVYYNINPPEVPINETKQLKTPLQEYVHKLLYSELCRSKTDKVLKQLRKINWDQKEESEFAISSICAVWNMKYQDIRYVASIVAGLVYFHNWIGTQVIDWVLEDIRMCMEINEPKHNQRRVAVMKFFGELYNYRLFDSNLVIKILYSTITFGTGMFGDQSFLDINDHQFRLKLVCILLGACGMYMKSGSSKKKMDFFLLYYQLYYWRVRSIYDVSEEIDVFREITQIINDTFATVNPNLKLSKSLEEAQKGVKTGEEELVKTLKSKAPHLLQAIGVIGSKDSNADGLGTIAEEDDTEDSTTVEPNLNNKGADNESCDENNKGADNESCDEYGSDAEEEEPHYIDGDDESETEEDEDSDDLMDTDDDESERKEMERDMESWSLKSKPKLIECDENNEFLDAFDKMLNENVGDSRGAPSRSQQKTLVAPINVKQRSKPNDTTITTEDETSHTMQFSLLLRKGAKQTFKAFDVPLDSDLSTNLQKQEKEDRLEKERVKLLTLQINERQEEEEVTETLAAMQRPTLVTNVRQEKRTQQPHKGTPNVDWIFKSKSGGP